MTKISRSLVALALFSFAACGKEDSQKQPTSGAATPSTPAKEVVSRDDKTAPSGEMVKILSLGKPLSFNTASNTSRNKIPSTLTGKGIKGTGSSSAEPVALSPRGNPQPIDWSKIQFGSTVDLKPGEYLMGEMVFPNLRFVGGKGAYPIVARRAPMFPDLPPMILTVKGPDGKPISVESLPRQDSSSSEGTQISNAPIRIVTSEEWISLLGNQGSESMELLPGKFLANPSKRMSEANFPKMPEFNLTIEGANGERIPVDQLIAEGKVEVVSQKGFDAANLVPVPEVATRQQFRDRVFSFGKVWDVHFLSRDFYGLGLYETVESQKVLGEKILDLFESRPDIGFAFMKKIYDYRVSYWGTWKFFYNGSTEEPQAKYVWEILSRVKETIGEARIQSIDIEIAIEAIEPDPAHKVDTSQRRTK